MSVFQQIIAGAQREQAADQEFAQNIGQQFAQGVFEGREQRKLEDAALTQAEAKLDFLSQQEGFDPSVMEKFIGSKKIEDKIAIAAAAETMFGLQQEQVTQDLERENIESQIALRSAQAKQAGSAGTKLTKTDIVDPTTGQAMTVMLDSAGNVVKTVGQAVGQPKRILTPKEEADLATKIGRGKNAMDSNEATIQIGEAANGVIANANEALNLLDQGNFETGFIGDTINKGKKAFLALAKLTGNEELLPENFEEGIANAESFNQKAGDFFMKVVAQAKGAVSDFESKKFESFSPSLAQTPEGNRAMIGFMLARAERDRELGNMVLQWQGEDLSPTEIRRQKAEWVNQNDLSSMLDSVTGKGGKTPDLAAMSDAGQIPTTTLQPVGGGSKFTLDNPAQPQSQADLDALKKGTPYINPFDGQIYYSN